MINLSKIKQLIEKEEEWSTLDYKEDLNLETDGNKAQFVKDVLSLANSGQTSHIIIGIEDGTRKLLGIKTIHKAEQLNQILKDKSDPPVSIEYVEKKIMGHTIGVIEIIGDNPPYIVAVPDKYGGKLSSETQKQFHIERGTIFVRNYNMNEGASRADLDKMYKVKYVTLQSDLRLSHEVQIVELDNQKEVAITYHIENLGNALATDTYICIMFNNINKIKKCKTGWQDKTDINIKPTIIGLSPVPFVKGVITECSGVVVEVNKDINEIIFEYIIGASNMAVKRGLYAIPLKEQT